MVAVIGDLVRSRESPRRADTQRALLVALRRANGHVPAVQQLRSTIGDEFQAIYADLADGLRATLLVHLLMRRSSDVRFGLGLGAVTVFDPAAQPVSQDGPAWWSARDAIDDVKRAAHRQGHARTTRTRFKAAATENASTPNSSIVNAFLVLQDELVANLSDRASEMVALRIEGRTISEIGRSLNVSASAVSQALAKGGYALVDAHARLEEVAT